MVLSNKQIELLQSYRDMAYVSNTLSEHSSNYYLKLKNIINFPLIVSSSAMTILNSSTFSAEEMKIPNIIINACTTLLLSLMNNFKFVEKTNNFKSVAIKFNKLTHAIENKLTNEMDTITIEQINTFILEYDNLNEQLDYPYPQFIRKKIKGRYVGKRTLPSILNCEKDFVQQQTVV